MVLLWRGNDGSPLISKETSVCPPPLYKSRVVGKGLGVVKKDRKLPCKSDCGRDKLVFLGM